MRVPVWSSIALSLGILTTLSCVNASLSLAAETEAPDPSLTAIRLNAQQHLLVLSVAHGGFDPVLHMERNEQGEYRILIEGENIQFDPALQQHAEALTQEFSRLMPEIQSVHLFQVIQNNQPTIKIIVDSRTRLVPQIRANSESEVTIALVVDTSQPPVRATTHRAVEATQGSYLSLTQPPATLATSTQEAAFSIYQLGFDLDTPEALQQAWSDYRAGNLEQAADRVTQYLQSKPQDPTAHFLRSQLYLAETKREAAVQELQKILNLDATYLPARIELMTLQLAAGHYTDVEELLHEGETQSLNHPELLYSKGLLLEAQGKLPEAREAYLKAVAQSPYNLFYHYRLAITELKNNNPKAAEWELQRVLLHNPDDVEALKLMGYLSQKANQPEAALQYYQKALRPDGLMNYATLLYGQNQTEEALAILKTVELMAANDPEIQYNLGMWYVDYKLKKLAEKPLNRFLNLTTDPNDPRVTKVKASLKDLGLRQTHITIGTRP